MARMAGLRCRAGEKDKAEDEAEAALALFDGSREEIISVYWARTLRPLAEAYETMGDRSASLAMYKKVVEEGAKNPNARPRAVDLSATLSSMALHGVEPDTDLWNRLVQIHDKLGDPW
jgi:hypothetical protein